MARTIAVIIRDPQLRGRVAQDLQRAGARVIAGDLATQAWNHGRDAGVDLMVVDMHLTDAHGDDVLRDLRELPDARPLPVIMLIEEDDDWFRERAERTGAEAVLTYAEAGTVVQVAGRLLRADVRVEVRGFADYYLVQSSERRMWSAETLDISLSGVALQAPVCELEPEFLVDVRLRLPELSAVMGRAVVVRVQPAGAQWKILLKWEGFRQGDRERLAAWIRARVRPA